MCPARRSHPLCALVPHLAAALAALLGLWKAALAAVKGRVGRKHFALLASGLAGRVGALPLLILVLGVEGVAANGGRGHDHTRNDDARNGAAAQAAATVGGGGRGRGDGSLVGSGAAGGGGRDGKSGCERVHTDAGRHCAR